MYRAFVNLLSDFRPHQRSPEISAEAGRGGITTVARQTATKSLDHERPSVAGDRYYGGIATIARQTSQAPCLCVCLFVCPSVSVPAKVQ